MRKVISDICDKDDVIIIGRGAQIILGDRPGVTHLRFDGNTEKKIIRVMEREGLVKSDAADRIRKLRKKT